MIIAQDKKWVCLNWEMAGLEMGDPGAGSGLKDRLGGWAPDGWLATPYRLLTNTLAGISMAEHCRQRTFTLPPMPYRALV
jgi:hypothetical protein